MKETAQESTSISIPELVALSAADGQFFTQQFFPRMARQAPPVFHRKLWSLLESNDRFINLQVFRGGAKTSTCRAYTAKRIAFGLARTVLYIGKSEGHAIRSVSWLKDQVEHNKLYRDTFKLRKGSKWQDTEMQIEHGIEGHMVWVMAMGITGSIRGINRDDFRPDLIVLDDVTDDENAATKEQRDKISARIYGAVKESLAPRSESPSAKLTMLQTPIHKEDASMKALEDPEWVSARFGCFTEETADKPVSMQESSWPARWGSEELRKEKQFAIARNQSSIWYREKECKLIDPENTAFKTSWLKYYEERHLPDYGTRILVIDPVPPPSPKEVESGMLRKDFECLHVVQQSGKDLYSVEYKTRKGHDPSWTIATMFELLEKYEVLKIMVESVAYQRTLAWLIRQAMEQRGKFWQVVEFTDNRSKFIKIVDSLNGVASNGHLFVKQDQTDLISQFRDYPQVSHDDVLETLALGVMELTGRKYAENNFNVAASLTTEALDYNDYCKAP